MNGIMHFTSEPGDKLAALRETIASIPLDDTGACKDTLLAARTVASGKFKDADLMTLVVGLERTGPHGAALGRQILAAFTHDYATSFAKMQAKEAGHA